MSADSKVDVVIDNDGRIRFIYSDALAAAFEDDGTLRIARASHVEPHRDPAYAGWWVADMSPVGGVVLGPFKTRGEALAREVAYLSSLNLPFPG
jgi:hypothetical protein